MRRVRRPFYRSFPHGWLEISAWIAIAPLGLTVDAIHGTVAAVRGTRRAVSRTMAAVELHLRARYCRLPKSEPLVEPKPGEEPAAVGRSLLLRLPPELRLRIYQLAFGTDSSLVQPTLHGSLWGQVPDSWRRGQHICSDADPPSEGLRFSIRYGGSGLNQIVGPSHEGCVLVVWSPALICSNVVSDYLERLSDRQRTRYAGLMCSCRAVYADMLDLLYSDTTLCLYNTDMIRFFLRNASPEGLQRVRYSHIALAVPSKRWRVHGQRRNVEKAMAKLRNSLPNLRQVHVEVALKGGRPPDPRGLWVWLREVFGVFRGLDAFVLKVSVHDLSDRDQPKYEALTSWDDAEYAALKEAVTRKDESCL